MATAYKGFVENGRIRIEGDMLLPERAVVYIIVPEPATAPVARLRSPRLSDRASAADFELQVEELSNDDTV